MLAGCSSSTLVSPRHRLRSEAPSAQFQARNYPMNTQRLDLACSSSRQEASRSQPIRPVGISVEKQVEPKKTACRRSLKQSIRLPPLAIGAPAAQTRDGIWEKGKCLKRFAEQGSSDDLSCINNRAKRKRANDDVLEGGGGNGNGLSLGQLGSDSFWFSQGFNVPSSPVPLTSSSGEEERGCFVPSEVTTNPNWVESMVNEIADVHRPVKETSGSSASSDSHSSGFRLNVAASEHDVGNGSRTNNPQTHGSTRNENVEEDNQVLVEHNGFELISLLAACVEAIGSKNIAEINHYIARLGELASPKGTTLSRLAAYYTEALALRVSRVWPHIFHITPPREFERVDDELGSALRFFNQVSPIPKFIHFTSNEILLRAFQGKDKVHIIDFDIKQGLQWPSFFQSLACRANPPSHVRITGIGESKMELNETGDRLAGFAEALSLPFEFHPVVDRLEDVRLWMLHVKEKETVAINCISQLHKTLYDKNRGALRDFLGLIRSTNPSIVVMAEQEASHNGPNLEARVASSLKYYSALFDSVDHSLPLESAARIKIEEMFAKEIRNIVACEGSDRLERHEEYEKWRVMMEQGGFRNMGISEREILQSQVLLKMYACENYFSIQRQQGQALTLSWLDQPLYTVSAWSPVDVSGSSSSFSQPS